MILHSCVALLLLAEPGPMYVDVAMDPTGHDVPSVETFYEALSPHGTWYDDATYGWAFVPSVPGYVPYTNGFWKVTDFGFTWISAEPFGWATDHYGRWVWANQWIWVPDTTWGPAWVQWRVGDGWVGWAPMGYGRGAYFPEAMWRFVPSQAVLTRDLRRAYAREPAEYLLHRTVFLERYHRHNGHMWGSGPDDTWLRGQRVAVRREPLRFDEVGRYDEHQRHEAERREAELRSRYRERLEREGGARHPVSEQEWRSADERRRRGDDGEGRRYPDPSMDERGRRGEGEERRRAADDYRRQEDQRREAEQQRRHEEENQRRQSAEHDREQQERRQHEEENQHRQQEEQRRHQEGDQRRQADQYRQQEEQRRHQEDDQRRQAEQERRQQEEQRRQGDQQRRQQEDQRRQVDQQRRQQEEQQRHQGDDQRRQGDDQRRQRDDQHRQQDDQHRQ